MPGPRKQFIRLQKMGIVREKSPSLFFVPKQDEKQRGEVLAYCAFSSALHVASGLRTERNIVAAIITVHTIISTT
jgi:hypothetical protein